MPQLFSRMDEMNWLTPPMADILDQGAPPPGGDGSIREQMLTLQQKLGDLETPARVINVRPSPSYTMFVAKPDVVNLQGNQRAVTIAEIKRSIGQIAEEKKEWKLGFLPQLEEVADTVGILLRTDKHKRLSLRRLLVRTGFREHPSTLAFVIGNTLEQRLVVEDFADLGGILFVGKEGSRQHFVHSVLLTLITLNTPGEVRIAITGNSSSTSQKFVSTPHALGRLLNGTDDILRFLGGLVKEIQRRQDTFQVAGVKNIDSYNEQLHSQDKIRLPRIVTMIDSLSDEDWQNRRQEWLPLLIEILRDAGQSGVHLILTADQVSDNHIPPKLEEYIPVSVIMRSSASDYTSQLDNFHGSLVRFIDAIVIDEDGTITPVEYCIVSQEEIEKAVSYWYHAAQQREREVQATRISGTTGVTGTLEAVDAQKPPHAPPPKQSPEEVPAVSKTSEIQMQSPVGEEVEAKIQQAQALAAYLGWIGMGPLQDILGLSQEQATRILGILRQMKLIENGNSPTPRFIPLDRRSSQPSDDDGAH